MNGQHYEFSFVAWGGDGEVLRIHELLEYALDNGDVDPIDGISSMPVDDDAGAGEVAPSHEPTDWWWHDPEDGGQAGFVLGRPAGDGETWRVYRAAHSDLGNGDSA